MAQAHQAFAQELLGEHNFRRARHNAPNLTLNKELCEQAQSWAEYLAKSGQLEHCRNTKGAGENIAHSTSVLPGDSYAHMWYKGSRQYNYESPTFGAETESFTQMVWKATREFGAGLSSSQYGTFVVARYLPGCNVVRDMKDNVLPLEN